MFLRHSLANASHPTLSTFRRVLAALILILFCLALQHLALVRAGAGHTGSLAHHPALPSLIVFNVIILTLVAPLAVFVSKQPQVRNSIQFVA